MARPHVRRIGLTGGIGSGKSTVCAIFEQLGAVVVDTDAISRELTAAQGAAIEPIRRAFGDAVIGADGALDRVAMRARAFADPQAKATLEAILHPMIAARTQAQADAAGDDAVLVFDVPLLVESGRWRARVDRVVVVDCSESIQVDRVMRRSRWDEATVRAVIAQQASREQRRACADAVIYNDGVSLESLATHVQDLWSRWCVPR